jgi:acyl carrier protein
MSREEIEKTVIEIVADDLYLDVKEVRSDSDIYEDLGADSLDDVEILLSLEAEFGISVPDDELSRQKLSTISAITDFIDKHLNS